MSKLTKSIFAVIAIIASVVGIFFIVSKVKHQKNIDVLGEIYAAYRSGDYETALDLSVQAPTPYNEYYQRFISKRIELDAWLGTEEELFYWLSDFIEEMELANLPENEYNKYDSLLRVAGLTKYGDYDYVSEFLKKKADIENKFTWYNEFYQIQINFYTEFFKLFLANRELFAGNPVSGIVSISCSTIKGLNSQMENLYFQASKDLYKLQESYNITSEDDIAILNRERDMMSDCKDTYDNHATLSHLYDISGKLYIDIRAENADNNYDAWTKLIRIEINTLRLSASLYDAFGTLNGIPEEYTNYEGPIRDVFKIIYQVFPDSTLTIEKFNYDVNETIRKNIESYI